MRIEIHHEGFDDKTDYRKEANIPPTEADVVTGHQEMHEVQFQYDGGRVNIYVNGVEVFAAMCGTRDCSITVKRQFP